MVSLAGDQERESWGGGEDYETADDVLGLNLWRYSIDIELVCEDKGYLFQGRRE